MSKVLPVSVLLLISLDLNIFGDLRGIMFDFVIGMGHRARKGREIRQQIYKGVIDFVTLRNLPEYVKTNKNTFDKYYKLHSILLICIPIQYIVVILGCIIDGANLRIPEFFCMGIIVIKTAILIVLLTKIDGSRVSKYAKKEYKRKIKSDKK